jgi:hypothetical protein
LIEVFQKNNFGDSMLPITEELDDLDAVKEETRGEIMGVFGDQNYFSSKIRDEFRNAHWMFISPVFTSDKFSKSASDECCYVFDVDHRLPFIEEGNRKVSNFSEVSKKLIHCDHLQGEGIQVRTTFGCLSDRRNRMHL